MEHKTYSRREFLRLSATTAMGLVVAACGAQTPAVPAAAPTAAPAAGAPTAAAAAAPTAAAAAAPTAAAAAPTAAASATAPAQPQGVTLDVVYDLPEYQSQFRQIFDLYEDENPGVKINDSAHSEDGIAAFQAKVAGGYIPAMERSPASIPGGLITQNNYKNFIDLNTIDFPHFDRWTYDVKTAWPELYGVADSGPRSLDPYQGFTMTWMYHQDLLEPAGLDPRKNVKTWDDLKKWLDEGTKWAPSAGLQYFWDQALLAPWWEWVVMDIIGVAFPDGQRERQAQAWKGEIPFNGPDSPYRHTYEFFKEAYDKGWLPKNFWTRQWEPDMETSFGNKKSAVMLHGPWPWDKTLGIDPKAKMLGFPATPPAEGQKEWRQMRTQPEFDKGWGIREGAQKLPEWEEIRKFYIWWNSPEVIPLRTEAEGRVPAYKLDTPLELKGAQYQGIVKEIDQPGGLFENVKYDDTLPGLSQAAIHYKAGTPGPWDWASGNIGKIWEDLMTGKTTVQQTLDINQKNWEASYPDLVKKA